MPRLYDRLAPIRADASRIERITVCTRPFRAIGPRIEAERLGEKLVVHNYGHGGSGWSLSWGSGAVALDLALAGRDPSLTDVGVIGCGALGLTAAILAQRAGVRSVTIYARELAAETRSFRATGSWTPDSRIARKEDTSRGFLERWERMARTSWQTYQRLLHLPGDPVEFTERFYLSDLPPDEAEKQKHDEDPIGFFYHGARLSDINPRGEDLLPGTHPFPTRWARRKHEMMFNITSLAQHLTDEFQRHGGRIVRRAFHAASDLAALPQPVLVHSTGYGARELFNDDSLTPVRGQIAWLPAQPEVRYGLYLGDLGMLSRRDGVVVQLNAEGAGWNDAREAPDRTEAEDGMRQLQDLYCRMANVPSVASP